MTHTPEPWVFVKDTRFTYEKYCVNHQNKHDIEAGLSTVVAEISEGPHGLADARLIATAPELLEACQEFVEHIKSLGTDTEKCRYLSMALNCRAGDLIEQAIAKATGG